MSHTRRWTSPSAAEILAQIPAAIAAEEAAASAEPRARAAWFDTGSRRVMMELTNGCIFGFPAAMVGETAALTDEVLGRVCVLPGGDGLVWEGITAAVSVPGFCGASAA